MIHGVELAGGEANWYRNRYIQTPMLGKPDPERMEHYLDLETLKFDYEVSTANTHVIGYGARIFALEEGSFPYELSNEADTIDPYDFDGKLTTAMTAHPKVCPETDELLFFAYSSMPPFLTYYRIDAAGNLVQKTEITVTGSTMQNRPLPQESMRSYRRVQRCRISTWSRIKFREPENQKPTKEWDFGSDVREHSTHPEIARFSSALKLTSKLVARK